MRIVIIGGTGLVGSKVVSMLRGRGHEVLPAARSTGVNAVSGEGLAEAIGGADVLIDVSNSSSIDDEATQFFETATRNILGAEATARIRHHIVLSVVGVQRLAANPYFRAKLAQEQLVRNSRTPYTILRSTQFFEFLKQIADNATVGGAVRLPSVLFQPIAAEEVARIVAEVAERRPVNGNIEIGGPETHRLDELVRLALRAGSDSREVVTDPNSRYFGSELDERSLMPDDSARLGRVTYERWHRDGTQILAVLTGETLVGHDVGGRGWPSADEIAVLAYSFYENGGRQNGHDLDDWLAAERQLRHHYA